MSTQQPKEKGVKWNLKEQKLLLVICLEYHKQNGIDTHFNWNEIAEKFSKRGERNVTGKDAKNKFDYMKTIWRAWSDLRFKETGAGWDEATHTIRATDDWWAMKLAEGDRYKRFRKKPVDPELSELWDAVYNGICATGQYARSGNMAKSQSQVDPPHEADRNCLEYYIGSEDELDYEGLGEGETPMPCPDQSPSVQKRSTPTVSTQTVQKGKKKRLSAAAQYKECMAGIDAANDKVLSMLGDEMVCTGSTSTKKGEYDLADAIEIIDRMVKDGALNVAIGIWCYAVDELNNDTSRRLFMTLKTDEEKLAWLNYKYNKHG